MTLRLWWLWLTHTNLEKTWATFWFPADRVAHAFFDASISVEVGDGTRALFWEDNWLASCSIKLLAPNLGGYFAMGQALTYCPGGPQDETSWDPLSR
jgi:hypothetical protein